MDLKTRDEAWDKLDEILYSNKDSFVRMLEERHKFEMASGETYIEELKEIYKNEELDFDLRVVARYDIFRVRKEMKYREKLHKERIERHMSEKNLETNGR